MTREEEIKQAYLDWVSDIECSEYTVWKDAVEWADKHPKQKEEHQRGLCGNMIN